MIFQGVYFFDRVAAVMEAMKQNKISMWWSCDICFTDDNRYVQIIITTMPFFPTETYQTRLNPGHLLTWATRRVPHVKQDLMSFVGFVLLRFSFLCCVVFADVCLSLYVFWMSIGNYRTSFTTNVNDKSFSFYTNSYRYHITVLQNNDDDCNYDHIRVQFYVMFSVLLFVLCPFLAMALSDCFRLPIILNFVLVYFDTLHKRA